MTNKFDIKSKNIVIGTASANTVFGIGRVPAGKQRFVTFVKAACVEYGGGATNTLYLGEYTASRVTSLAIATAAKKLTIPFDSTLEKQSEQVPEGGIDIESPLFVIEQSNFLVGRTSRGNIDVFVRYYDD